jgi:FO synthase
MRVVAVVPVQAFSEGKSRLAKVLSTAERTALIERMLGRVLKALQGARLIDGVVVVSPELDVGLPDEVEVLRDKGRGLNEAVSFAVQTLSDRYDAAVVVAADIPNVTSEEIDSLVSRAIDHDVVVVPDRRGEGTNALWMKFSSNFSPQYGSMSATRHLELARRLSLRSARVELPGLSHDIDVPDDLRDGLEFDKECLTFIDELDLRELTYRARELTLSGFGVRIGYSPKVFIPLTHLCRDVCHYCTFAAPPRKGVRAFMTIEEVLHVARQGAAAGCIEALFTLGDKPELRYAQAREELSAMGFDSTLSYLEYCARRVFEETGLLPHLNPGVMSRDDMRRLRAVSVSMGLMMENLSPHLSARGAPHHRSPDKQPSARLDTLNIAGELSIPFTTGLLIGIGESRLDRVQTLLAIRDSHRRYGHVQEIIIQNFRAKPNTRMANAPEPELEELQWTIAVARLIFGPTMSIQAPPNLSAANLTDLIEAGINDWGGVSPVTADHVNPEAPWPELDVLKRETMRAGRWLVQRLPIVMSHALESKWIDPSLRSAVLRRIDASGYVRETEWHAGAGDPPLRSYVELVRQLKPVGPISSGITVALQQCLDGAPPGEEGIARLLRADGADYQAVIAASDELRRAVCGDTVSFVVNRNINYTNICVYSCGFCAFAKGRGARSLRGPGYRLDTDEIGRRVIEAANQGATEVCLQGGIHPSFTGDTYLEILRAVRSVAPDIHIHAFSPLEVTHGAETLGLPIREFLYQLKAAGLNTLPGTAAEILSDDVRSIICPDKLDTQGWLDVMRDAHAIGLRSTATIMFGHVDTPQHWARHLLEIRSLQSETQGFTEFVPLPFVYMEAPIWRRGLSRSGPSWRESMLMHAVARLVLEPVIRNIQASWVKLGRVGALEALRAGANDLGGVLMNESITRAAGGVNGQCLTADSMVQLIRSAGRQPRQRTSLYGNVRIARSRSSSDTRTKLEASA